MTPAETATILRQFNKWLRGNKDDPQLESREINQAINAAIEMIERLEAAEKERDALRVELNEIRYWTAVAHDTIKALNARIEAAEKERDALRSLVVMRFDHDHPPQFTQGYDTHELTEPVTAEHCRGFVAEIERLSAEVAHIKEVEFPRKAQAVADGWRGKCERLEAKIEAMERQELGFRERCTPSSPTGYSNRFPLYALPGARPQPAPSVPTTLLVAVADLVAQMEIVSRVGFVDTPNDKDSCAAFCVAEGTWLELMRAVESLASALAAAPEART